MAHGALLTASLPPQPSQQANNKIVQEALRITL
jgi:hypothetical protein